MKPKRILTLLFSLIITIVIVFILFKVININDLTTAFSELSPMIILLSFLAYFLSYIFKTLRFYELNQKIKFKKLFSIVCIHNFFNNLIPARVGELSYVYLIGKEKNGSTESGVASLIISRIMDLGLIFLLSFLALIIFKSKLNLNEVTYNILIIAIGIVFIIFYLTVFSRRQVVSLVKKIIEITKIKKINFFLTILSKIKLAFNHFKSMTSKRTIILSVIYSIGIVVSQYFFFYVIMIGLGVEISFIEVVLGSMIILIAVILPIQGIGGFGTYEGAWTLALIYLGISSEIAITTSFIIHILQLAYLIVLGVLGLVYYKLFKKEYNIDNNIHKEIN